MNYVKVDEGSILFHAKTPRSKVAKDLLGVLLLIFAPLREQQKIN